MSEYILIVDDQISIRTMFEELLLCFDYKVKTAANGWECLKAVRSEKKPALILLDYEMPYMTGIEVMLVLKKDLAIHRIPVIIVSGSPNIHIVANNHGAHAVLAKPVDLDMLLETIDQALAEKKITTTDQKN